MHTICIIWLISVLLRRNISFQNILQASFFIPSIGPTMHCKTFEWVSSQKDQTHQEHKLENGMFIRKLDPKYPKLKMGRRVHFDQNSLFNSGIYLVWKLPLKPKKCPHRPPNSVTPDPLSKKWDQIKCESFYTM